ncbi:helix-turn-helix domain-containing protein [Brevibacillus sp. LEMMJ03]|uniref:helix-turn-helix domain-containing protein n=1 Tax=Brevibacillus sp. LEMMJ03 TaxID=2595056 RepID=UPI00163D9875|nr:helix-turn-helix transcriptional regulator [Brevibacillus sp. LEMMJ03]
MDQIEFGQYLRSLRKKRGLTIRQLEDVSGVSNSYISQIEKGEKLPSPDILRKLHEHLGVSHGELMIKAGHINLADWIGDDDEDLEKGKINLADWIGDNDQTKELSNFLHQPDITYHGHKLTDQDKQLITAYLDALFRDRISEK